MKIDTSKGNIEVYGDVKEFKTSIDPKNLEFITTLLSSNLYSDPEQSFIREIVSNAWDSHVEAGTTNIPVIIRFKNNADDKSITIRDYGTGLSPERFKEVYCNIGSSTKRESNDYIGGFGIGKYSSLACSNTVYITSYYNNTAYQYIMVKSGNSITTNLVLKSYTEEKNGVEVTIKSIARFQPFIKALDYIVFFPNIYVDGEFAECKSINDVKLKRFKNFAAATKNIDNKLLLGNVLYPCNNSLMPLDVQIFLYDIRNTGIVIKFDVGEINITPNRESIIYTSDTIKKIADRIKAAEQELNELINTNISRDYTDIVEYHRLMSRAIYYEPVENKISSNGYRVVVRNISDIHVTYRGKDLKKDIEPIGQALNMAVPNFRGVVSYDRIYTKKLPWGEKEKVRLSYKQFLICNVGLRMFESIKMFVRDNYCGYTIVTDFSKEEFKLYIKDGLDSIMMKLSSDNEDLIITGLYESLLNRSKRINFDTDPNYLKFKDELSKNKVQIVPIKEPIIYIFNKGYRDKLTFKALDEVVRYIKNLQKGVILLNMDVDEVPFMSIARAKGMEVIKARKDIVASLKEMGLSCLVDVNWLLHNDPLLDKVYTINKYFQYGGIAYYVEVTNLIPEGMAADFRELMKIYRLWKGNAGYAQIARSNGKIDPYTEIVCKRLITYIRKYKEVSDIIKESTNSSVGGPIDAAVVLKTKSFRVNYRTYKKVKDNKLINILCRK